MKQHALIYCRVSTMRQTSDGHGLESQEHRCRDYAAQKGYTVSDVFRDSYSGGGDFMQRPAMRALLAYLDQHADTRYVVIFDDLKRFARDTIFHWILRKELEQRGASVECLNFRFEDTPEGEFIETIIAAQGQLERKQISRQVSQKMKARLEKGYWAFHAPVGYKMQKHPAHGVLMVRDEPKATIIQTAFEGFASGRFATQTDVQRYLQEQDFNDGRPVYISRVEPLLRRFLYSGYIEYKPWGVARRKGHHEPIVSLSIYEKVQQKLSGGKRSFTRKDMRQDFPLRGYVKCTGCAQPLTASWSTGRNGQHAYYRCRTKPSACPWGGKSIKQDVMHTDYGNLLLSYQSKPKAIVMCMEVALDLWKQEYAATAAKRKEAHLRELKAIGKQIAALTEKIAAVESTRVMKALEQKVDELAERELLLQEKSAETNKDPISFGTALEAVLGTFKNLYDTWDSDDFDQRILAQTTVSIPPSAYDRNSKFGTAEIPLIPAVFQQFERGGSEGVQFLKNNWNQFKGEVIRIYYLLNREK